jgi:hypothetical protein
MPLSQAGSVVEITGRTGSHRGIGKYCILLESYEARQLIVNVG